MFTVQEQILQQGYVSQGTCSMSTNRDVAVYYATGGGAHFAGVAFGLDGYTQRNAGAVYDAYPTMARSQGLSPEARDDDPAAGSRPDQRRDRGRRHPGRPARARPGRRPVLAELRNRGIKDVLFVCCDGLGGLPEPTPASARRPPVTSSTIPA